MNDISVDSCETLSTQLKMKAIVLVLSALLVAIHGQEVILDGPGIIEPDVKQCEQELLRYQTWDHRIMIAQHRIRSLYNTYEAEMNQAFNSHPDLLEKMDDYSLYQTALPDLRGVGDYEDCDDLCPSEPFAVGAVVLKNISMDINGRPKPEVCFIVQPEKQNFYYQRCMTRLAKNVPYSNDFQMKYACVPDGFIKRKLIVYCPFAPMGQCKEVEVSVPMACSPKLAKCTFTAEYVKKNKSRKTLENKESTKKQNSYLKNLFKF